MDHKQIINSFYKAFSEGKSEEMAQLYHDEALFSDPVFGELQAADVRDMWRMLLERSKGNLQIEWDSVEANGDSGSAQWTARYPFGPKKRPVVNVIQAQFEFRDDKIFRHRDHFDLWKWSGQALGPAGKLMGWTSLIQNSIRKKALSGLHRFQLK